MQLISSSGNPVKLIDLDTGEEIVPTGNDRLITIRHNLHKGKSFAIGEIVEPCREEPDGLIRSKKSNGAWKELYPCVFNARLVVHVEPLAMYTKTQTG